jgi:hypothetical protein
MRWDVGSRIAQGSDAGTGEEDAAIEEAGFAIEVFDQFFGRRFMAARVASPEKTIWPARRISSEMAVVEGRGSLETRTAGPGAQERS